MIIRSMLAIAVLAVGVTAVVAQSDPIATRRAAMKAVGDQNRIATEMIEAKRPFSAADAKKVLATFNDSASKLSNLFPDNSKTGDTDASPKIWSARAEFNAAIDTFIATAKTAAATIKDEATFKAEYPKVVRSCGGCHKDADGFSPRLADSFKKMK